MIWICIFLEKLTSIISWCRKSQISTFYDNTKEKICSKKKKDYQSVCFCTRKISMQLFFWVYTDSWTDQDKLLLTEHQELSLRTVNQICECRHERDQSFFGLGSSQKKFWSWFRSRWDREHFAYHHVSVTYLMRACIAKTTSDDMESVEIFYDRSEMSMDVGYISGQEIIVFKLSFQTFNTILDIF
jgi:hypothetical protein